MTVSKNTINITPFKWYKCNIIIKTSRLLPIIKPKQRLKIVKPKLLIPAVSPPHQFAAQGTEKTMPCKS